jgi:MFS family permease
MFVEPKAATGRNENRVGAGQISWRRFDGNAIMRVSNVTIDAQVILGRVQLPYDAGLLQVGYLLATLASLVVVNWLGLSWRWLFGCSIIPALISLLIRSRVRESEAWKATRERMRLTRTRTRARDVLRDPAIIRRFVGYAWLLAAADRDNYGSGQVDDLLSGAQG